MTKKRFQGRMLDARNGWALEETRLGDVGVEVNSEIGAFQQALTTSTLRIAVLGNCQMAPVTRCLQALVGGDWPHHEWINQGILADMAEGRRDLTEFFDQYDKVFMQPWIWAELENRYRHMLSKVVLYPNVFFIAYHPDLVYITNTTDQSLLVGPCGHYHSSIALMAWKAGLGVADALKLFNRNVYRLLGLFNFWELACSALRHELRFTGLPETLLDRWIERDCFMFSINHPKLFVIEDVVTHLLRRLGIETLPGNPVQFTRDFLADSIVWPVYPEFAEHFGCSGDYLFKLSAPDLQPDKPVRMLDLEKLVTLSYAEYSRHAPQDLYCNRLDTAPYLSMKAELEVAGATQRFAGTHTPAPAISRADLPSPAHTTMVGRADLGWINESRRHFDPMIAALHDAA